MPHPTKCHTHHTPPGPTVKARVSRSAKSASQSRAVTGLKRAAWERSLRELSETCRGCCHYSRCGATQPSFEYWCRVWCVLSYGMYFGDVSFTVCTLEKRGVERRQRRWDGGNTTNQWREISVASAPQTSASRAVWGQNETVGFHRPTQGVVYSRRVVVRVRSWCCRGDRSSRSLWCRRRGCFLLPISSSAEGTCVTTWRKRWCAR